MWLPISSSLTFAIWHQYSGEPQKVKEDREEDVAEVSPAGMRLQISKGIKDSAEKFLLFVSLTICWCWHQGCGTH